MASLTIDQLKKELTDHGVPLPASSAKKKDYVKLYEDNIGVSSSNVDNKNDSSSQINVDERIKSLSDDELYQELRDLGIQCGPVGGSTRRVYEIRLAKILIGVEDRTTPTPVKEINGTPTKLTQEELIDSRSNSIRDPTPELNLRARRVTPIPESVSKPTRYSFIETISKDSSQRFIQPIEGDFSQFKLPAGAQLQRESTPSYKGKWSPDIAKYTSHLEQNEQQQPVNYKRMVFIFLSGLLILTFACLLHQQWNATDPYKLLEEDVEKEIQQIQENTPNN